MNAIFQIISVFGVWGWAELFGSFAVAFGCVGELWLLLNEVPENAESRQRQKWWVKIPKRIARSFVERFILICVRLKWLGIRIPPAKKNRLERIFVSLIACGVSIELFALFFSLPETAKIGRDAAEAKLRASSNEWQLVIAQSNLAALQLQVQWRTITPDQEINLVRVLSPVAHSLPQGHKAVLIKVEGADNPEAKRYAARLGRVLMECGFEVTLGGLNIGVLNGGDGVLINVKSRANPPPHAIPIVNALQNLKIQSLRAEENPAMEDGLVTIWVLPKPEK